MNFFDTIKSFLGLKGSNETVYSDDSNLQEKRRRQLLAPESQRHFSTNDDGDGVQGRNEDDFQLFASNDPFEVHRFFQREMDSLMHSFGLHNFFGNLDSFVEKDLLPSIEEDGGGGVKSLREQYLKPGSRPITHGNDQADTDIDGEFDVGQIESELKKQDSPTIIDGDTGAIDSYRNLHQNEPIVKFFGQSVTTETFTRTSDGVIETRHTVTDTNGNKKVTITYKKINGEEPNQLQTKLKLNEEIQLPDIKALLEQFFRIN